MSQYLYRVRKAGVIGMYQEVAHLGLKHYVNTDAS